MRRSIREETAPPLVERLDSDPVGTRRPCKEAHLRAGSGSVCVAAGKPWPVGKAGLKSQGRRRCPRTSGQVLNLSGSQASLEWNL